MQIKNKNVLIIVSKKELFDSFMTNTIYSNALSEGVIHNFLEFKNDQEYEASKLLEKIKSSPDSQYDEGIILFPLNEKSNCFKHNEMPVLNDFLFSNGTKQMSGIKVGKNGCLEYEITRIL